MKKLLFVLLLTISSIVHAQWILINENDAGNKFFVEANSIQQVDKYIRAWFKTEYSLNSTMAVETNIRSGRFYEEFDCREKKVRDLVEQYYKKPNLIDLKVNLNETQPWRFVPPGTILDNKLKFVCKSK
jgi:hypothetical protein